MGDYRARWVRVRTPQPAAVPGSNRNEIPMLRPPSVFWPQPWSTASSQTKKKMTASTARNFINMVASLLVSVALRG